MTDINIQQRGKLYIFLGYAPGVGKTHRMLAEGLHQQQLGKNVVPAYVKSFVNAGYKSILDQLWSSEVNRNLADKIPTLETLVDQNPDIVLIDDIQERMVAISSSSRRYMLVEALLNIGIDVYCTLNICHIESLNDIVTKLIGFRIEQTVPDRLIDFASDIEIVDLAIPSLLTRYELKQVSPHGSYEFNAYQSTQKLLTLRQLTVRYVSQHMSSLVHKTNGAISSLSSHEKLMVCISSSPLSAKLVRSAYRLAKEIHAEWLAVYVEGANRRALDEESQKRLNQIMHLVEELGGKVVTIHGDSIATTLMLYAQQHATTRIIIGHSNLPRWQDLFRGSIVHQLVKQNNGIDIYVINSGQDFEPLIPFKSRPQNDHKNAYIKTSIAILIATVIGFIIYPFVFPATLVTLYLLVIMFVAGYLGYRPAIAATVLSVVSFLLFFIPAPTAMGTENLPYIAILVGLSIAGIAITRLVGVAIERANIANQRADQIMELYSLSRDLSTVVDLDEIVKTLIAHISQTLQAEVAVFLSGNQEILPYHITANFPINDAEKRLAGEVYQRGEPGGFGITYNTDAIGLYLPLRTAHQIEGVIGVVLPEHTLPTLNQRRLLDAFANQAALAIGANRLIEQAHHTRLIHEREKLQSALLDSISHDLRTPLVSITGALSSLRDESNLFDEEARYGLLTDALDEAEHLNRLVENLLEMSRLQAGGMSLNLNLHDLDDVIAVARVQLKSRLREHQILTHLQKDMPLVMIDFNLIVQVIVNLLDNAVKYTPSTEPIEICLSATTADVMIKIMDRGSGIPEAELPYIFEKFYRATNVNQFQGTGLGLSICAGIIEAHKGTIRADNRPDGGTVFEICLPIKEGI